MSAIKLASPKAMETCISRLRKSGGADAVLADKAAAELTALTERVQVLEATLSYVEQEMSDPQKGKFTALQVVRGAIPPPPPAGPGDGG